ncbi:MAG: MBL fold metallo-hydrolase [Candidatus Rokubacteria bacterium]|nr:MBL fold metallo-hydrolase [Candidatus Rokubacteria bacterium]
MSLNRVVGGVPILLAGLLAGCAGVGDSKAGAPAHHAEGGFRNPNPAYVPAPAWVRTKFFLSRIWATTFHPRTASLPRVENDGRALRGNRSEATVTWVGHSTLLIQLDGVNLLTDPQWSERASPLPFMGPKRVTPPGLRFEDLPPIHLVLISHDHYDHLDVATVARLAEVHRPLFLVPLGLKAWFAGLGITSVEELDWWESRSVRGLTLTCLPAQHFSSRTFWDRNRRLWSGWAVAGRAKRLFFAGDTGYYDVFKEIGRRLGPFDLAAVPIGAYVPAVIMRPAHTTPEEALQLFEDVRGRRFLGVHWGTFDLTEEPIEEPPKRLAAEARRRGIDPDRLFLLKHGETRHW